MQQSQRGLCCTMGFAYLSLPLVVIPAFPNDPRRLSGKGKDGSDPPFFAAGAARVGVLCCTLCCNTSTRPRGGRSRPNHPCGKTRCLRGERGCRSPVINVCHLTALYSLWGIGCFWLIGNDWIYKSSFCVENPNCSGQTLCRRDSCDSGDCGKGFAVFCVNQFSCFDPMLTMCRGNTCA